MYVYDAHEWNWDALRSVYREPAEDLFWTSMRALAAAYAASTHEPTLLTLSNLDAFCKAEWEAT